MKKETAKVFATNLQKLLDKKDMTRADLSKVSGIPYTTLASWFAGYRYPRPDKLDQLATILGVSASSLLSDIPEDTTSTGFIRQLFHDDPEVISILDKAAVDINGLPYGAEVPDNIKSILRNALLLAAQEVERIKASK